MATLDNLRSQGWHLTSDGLNKLCEHETSTDVRIITRKALDVDIRDIGAPIIATEISKSSFGPVILQVVKIRNISAPKSKPNSQAAPRMLKVILTDGHTNCQGIEHEQLSSINADKTIPGTKILINGAQILSNFLLLSPETCKLLGGHVSALIEKWELSKLMPSHFRVIEDGPPAWVNFGKKIICSSNSQGFKSLENRNKENSKEDAEFQVQRQDAIAEATHGAIRKIFGGGVKPAQTFNSVETTSNHYNSSQRAPRPGKNKNKEKSDQEKAEKPSQRVSLFDFLEDKLPLNDSNPTKANTEVPPQKFKSDFDSAPRSKPAENHSSNYSSSNYPQPNYPPPNYPPPNYPPPNYPPPNYPPANYQPSNYSPSNYSSSNSSSQKVAYKDTNKFKSSSNFNSARQEVEMKPPKMENRYQNDKPPRFQKQQKWENAPKFANVQNEPRTKPNTNNFVDKITHEINNISLYNSKYENERLNRQPARNVDNPNKPWKWKVGDRCMAKYWEDNKFYNAVVTGITNRTCMVEFIEYGNFEEVLHCDCIPITTEKEERQQGSRSFNDNQQFSGSLEFRRGKNRPFVRTPNKVQGQSKNYVS